MQPYENWLFVSDVDGTLAWINDIPRRNLEVIRKFTSMGGIFTLCTGRAYGGVLNILDRTEVTAPVITMNGGTIYDHRAGRALFREVLPESGKAAVLDVIRAFPSVGVVATTDEFYYFLEDDRALAPEILEHKEKMVALRGFKTCFFDEAPAVWNKCCLEVPPELVGPVMDLCRAMGREELAFLQTADHSIEVMSAKATKGQGLSRLVDLLGLDMARTGAVGDHYNDLDLLQTAAWSAAVHGAPEPVRQAADYVTRPFEEGATADALERFMAWIDEKGG